MKITCDKCKEKIETTMYFHNENVVITEYPLSGGKEYNAVVWGRFFCPVCGAPNDHKFTSLISKTDIINMCTKGEG